MEKPTFTNIETATAAELASDYATTGRLLAETQRQQQAHRDDLLNLRERGLAGENVAKEEKKVHEALDQVDLNAAVYQRRLDALHQAIPAKAKAEAEHRIEELNQAVIANQHEQNQLTTDLLALLAKAALLRERITGPELLDTGNGEWRQAAPSLDFSDIAPGPDREQRFRDLVAHERQNVSAGDSLALSAHSLSRQKQQAEKTLTAPNEQVLEEFLSAAGVSHGDSSEEEPSVSEEVFA
ncbi:MAG: hypothetical protein U5J62_06400 [Desulfurivibrio sp.]|nr:hypothetical protein [Desulfurivibrio sp.]